MKHSTNKIESGFDLHTIECSYTGFKETIDVYYVIDKATSQKKPRYFKCLKHENCENRDKCPVWDDYCTQLKHQAFLARFY